MVWVIGSKKGHLWINRSKVASGIPRYHGVRARDFLYQSIQCSLEVVAWHLAIEEFEIWKQNSRKKSEKQIKVQRKKFSIFFTDFTSQFIVHILGFALNWCHSHGDILWFCLWSPAHVSFPPTMNSVCLRWCFTDSTMVNHHKTTISICFISPIHPTSKSKWF